MSSEKKTWRNYCVGQVASCLDSEFDNPEQTLESAKALFQNDWKIKPPSEEAKTLLDKFLDKSLPEGTELSRVFDSHQSGKYSDAQYTYHISFKSYEAKCEYFDEISDALAKINSQFAKFNTNPPPEPLTFKSKPAVLTVKPTTTLITTTPTSTANRGDALQELLTLLSPRAIEPFRDLESRVGMSYEPKQSIDPAFAYTSTFRDKGEDKDKDKDKKQDELPVITKYVIQSHRYDSKAYNQLEPFINKVVAGIKQVQHFPKVMKLKEDLEGHCSALRAALEVDKRQLAEAVDKQPTEFPTGAEQWLGYTIQTLENAESTLKADINKDFEDKKAQFERGS